MSHLIINGVDKTLDHVYVNTGSIVKEAWEARDKSNHLLWGRADTFTGTNSISARCYGLPVKSWEIDGNSQQSGTPAPDDPIYPEFVGEKTENLFDKDNITDGGDFYVGGQSIIASANSDVLMIPCKPTTTYTVKRSVVLKRFAFAFVTDATLYNGMPIYGYTSDVNGTVITSTSDADSKYLVLYYAKHAGSDSNTAEEIQSCLNTLMVVEGDVAPDSYIPYGTVIPITSAGQIVPVYFGQVQTLRRIKKLVLTGEEEINGVHESSVAGVYCASMRFSNCGATDIIDYNKIMANIAYPYFVCSHLKMKKAPSSADMWYDISEGEIGANSYSPNASTLYYNLYFVFCIPGCTTARDFQNYFAAQYAARTPVTVWYALATPTTGIVNEPLAKIGTYADTLTSEQAGITIPTTDGSNTISVDTALAPSKFEVKVHAKPIAGT